MKVAQQNHRVIANNIANADTPGYNPVHLDFDESLKAAIQGRGAIALRRTRPQHLDVSRSGLHQNSLVVSGKNDYNKVDIEEEISNLSENRGKYLVYGSILVKQFQMAKNMLQNAR